MNKVILIGRLTKDPDVRWTQGQDMMHCMARFTLAVDRRFKRRGEDTADFISCIAFGKTAEGAEKYWRKGMKIGLTGRIQTGSYINRDNNRVYTTDVVADEWEFVESKKDSEQSSPPEGTPSSTQDATAPREEYYHQEEFMHIPDNFSDELPFM